MLQRLIFSQVLHIPFNALVNPVFNQFGFIALPLSLQNSILSVFLGLSAGLFEELSRYAMYRWWAKDARSWGKGLLAGAGHGGIEAILLGFSGTLWIYPDAYSTRNGYFDPCKRQIKLNWPKPKSKLIGLRPGI